MDADGNGHPFERLCAEGAAKRWCWNLFCTTCGALDLRKALWRLATEMPAPAGTRLVGAWPHRIQRELIERVESAPVGRIVWSAPFPDGLGYLGMVLSVVADAEQVERRLTQAWCPQLAGLVDREPSLYGGPDSSWPARFDVLRWQDLERVEGVMRMSG